MGLKTGSDAAAARKGGMKLPMKKVWLSCLHVSSMSATKVVQKNQRNNPHGFCDMRVFLTLMET